MTKNKFRKTILKSLHDSTDLLENSQYLLEFGEYAGKFPNIHASLVEIVKQLENLSDEFVATIHNNIDINAQHRGE